MRLDQYLVINNYFESRNKAQMAIENNSIKVNNKIINKSNYNVLDNDIIKVLDNTLKYVSRAGLKLEHAIKEFNLDLSNKVILDIGSSTGGFSDCSIQNGAKLVYAVDVGTNQLHEKLRNNPKIISYENTNILDFDITNLEKIDFIVMDVSFVSIEYLLPKINEFVNDNNQFVCLIKPQFEVGKMKMKNGVVKDKSIHIQVINNVKEELNKYGLDIFKLVKSPILGQSGNTEFLALIKRGSNNNINILKVVK